MIDRKSAEYYRWGGSCEGWHLLKSEDLSIIEEAMPPGATEVRHYHRKARQFFYVLSGTLRFDIAGEMFDVAPRQGFTVDPGVPHRVFTGPEEGASFLVVSCPPSRDDRVE